MRDSHDANLLLGPVAVAGVLRGSHRQWRVTRSSCGGLLAFSSAAVEPDPDAPRIDRTGEVRLLDRCAVTSEPLSDVPCPSGLKALPLARGELRGILRGRRLEGEWVGQTYGRMDGRFLLYHLERSMGGTEQCDS